MKLSDYDYDLPKGLIAQTPLKNRSDSRLMVLTEKSIEHRKFSEISEYFKKDDVLVINSTKVLKAKLVGEKKTGGKVEVILSPDFPYFDISSTQCRCRTTRRVKCGAELIFGRHHAKIIEKNEDFSTIIFEKPVMEVMDDVGQMPLPPYIKKKLERQVRYQTKYANIIGSIAAPTAGLHFSPEILDRLRFKGVKIVEILLHVSFGTFTPIRSDEVLEHKMDKEYFEITPEVAKVINSCNGRLFVVGTTTLKALESSADKDGNVISQKSWSDLFLTPAYKYRVDISGLITNFHLPKSTLILLVAGFIGKDRILEAYGVAVKSKYRFFSFGDSMLILK